MRYLFLTACLVLASGAAKAQVFGGNPPSLKFYQLNTDSIRVIFPKSLEKEAREVAWTVHQLYKNNPAPLGNKLRKFNVVLQNQTVRSNAYVGIAPYRSEYFMMPALNNITDGSIPWHLSLAVHEHRHMEQFANFNRTIPKLLGVFLGQEGQALGIGAAIPDWFFEGDAVWQETMVTQQGRGRLPNFFNAYRSLWLGNKQYSYMKLRNGSLIDFVPNHYDLGYLLVSYGREKYGTDFWKKITQQAVDYKSVFYPLQGAVKKETGVKYKQFVKESFNWFQQQMNVQQQKQFGNFQPVTKPVKNNVTSYQFPFELEDGSVLTLKSSYRKIPTWIRIDKKGSEQNLRVKDIQDDSYYSYRNGKVVYTAFEPHARWGWKNFSVIKVWNVANNTVQRISSKSRLFMPDISADGSSIIAAQVSTAIKSNLVLMRDGTEKVLSNPNEYIYTYPKFVTDTSSVISAVRNSKGEMTLLQTQLSTGSEVLLMPFVNTVISFVQVYGDTVFFTCAQKEGDVLFLLKRSSNELFKVIDLPNGNYQASYNSKTAKLYWNTFSADGTMLMRESLAQLSLQKTGVLPPLPQLYLSKDKFSSSPDIISNVQQQPGNIERYKNGAKLLNIHSWRPTLAEPDYGITFFSENMLNTFISEYSYGYNRNEGFHRAGASLVYGGFFPLLRAGVEQTWNRSQRITADTFKTWNQQNINIGFSIPLNLNSGRTFKSFNFTSSLNFERLNYTGIAKMFLPDENFNYISSSISFTNQSQQAAQHIFPRWAQTLRLQYRRTVNGETGNRFLANAGFYFPGLLRNHHFVLFGSVQSRDTLRGGLFSNSFPFARGYNVVDFPRTFRLSANYHFPVAYPDFGIGNMVYFLRIRANAFYDYTRSRSLRTGRLFPFSAAGCEIYFDTKIWNLFSASFGVRYSRLLNPDFFNGNRSLNQFEFILPVDLF